MTRPARAYTAALVLIAVAACGVALAGFSRSQGGGEQRGFKRAAGAGGGFGLAQGAAAAAAAVTTNDQLIPDATEATVTYFVSSSGGNNANSGLTEALALRTVAAGLAKLSTTPTDQRLLFKRGDVWTDEAWGRVRARGLSAAAPCVYGAYGTGDRPRFDVQALASAFYCQGGGGTPTIVDNVAFQDLNFYSYTRDPDNPSYALTNGSSGFYWLQGIDGFVMERVTFSFFGHGGSIQDAVGYGWANTMIFNECDFRNGYATSGNVSGFFATTQAATGADPSTTLIFRRCVFYHNGWNADIPIAQTVFNHNIYIQSNDHHAAVAMPILLEDSILIQGSSHGIQARSGGTIRRNLFVGHGVSILLGGGTVPVTGGVDGDVSDNVILEGRDIDGVVTSLGIDLDNLVSGGTTTVSGNRLANAVNPTQFTTLCLDTDADATYSDNVSHNWAWDNVNEYLTDASETTFARTLATYDASVGGPGTEANCIAKIIQRDPLYSTELFLVYFRAGF